VSGSRDPVQDRRWILICQSDIRCLELVARRPSDKFDRKLRGRLMRATVNEPERANSAPLRSGGYLALPTDLAVLDAILGEDPGKRRIAAACLAADAAELWSRRDALRGEVFEAADIEAHPFTAKSVRSVVSGGLPGHSKRRR
jgi:hypothetical protein